MIKFCPRCKSNKLTSEFYGNKASWDSLQSICKTCSLNVAKTTEGKLARKIHKSKNFIKYSQLEKQRKILDRYGLTIEQYLSYFDLQDDKCLNPTCLTKLEPYTKKACIDHNHKTGKVRGLLCQACNVRLGWFENRRSWVESYIG